MTQSTVGSVTGEIGEDVAALRADLAKLAGLVVDLARAQAETVREHVQQRWDHAVLHRSRDADLASDHNGTRRTGLKATVRRDPLPSLLLALAGGFALGMLSRR